jgi:hypothetical protein
MKTARLGWIAMLALAPALLAPAAEAAVASSGAGGFAVHHEYTFPGSPEAAWARLIVPARWWSAEHSYSRDAANFTLAAVPGGCWCETLPQGGFVRHMDVELAMPGHLLRLAGGLGPLQAMGVSGALTITLRAEGEGTHVIADYAVSGYSPTGFGEIAKAVDAVLGEQLARFVKP